MALNRYVGYGITTLLNWLINKRSNSKDEQNQEPSALNVQANESKIGMAIPVVLGRALIKSPAVSYFGDFSYKPYTETYAAHAKFNAWPLVFMLLAAYIARPYTTITTKPATTSFDANEVYDTTGAPVVTSGGAGKVDAPSKITGTSKDNKDGLYKDTFVGPLINSLFTWLLQWLINGRNLKTTIQKGFKYYLGWQHLVSWSGVNMRVRKLYLNENLVWSGDVSRASLNNGSVFDVRVDDENLFGGVDERGGFVGNIHTYLGGDNQGTDGWMVKEMGRESVQAELRGLTPAYKPFVSLVIPTAYIGKQSTIPKVWVELQNCPDNLGLGAIGEDANPAEALYEIITNDDWGLAESPETLDLDALKILGETCAKERLGVSILINNTQKAQNLLDSICAHINAVKYADPHTGKLVFRLIRDDYKLEDCLGIDTHNCSSVTFTRLDWSQIITKVSVNFTVADAKYETATVPTQDPAAIEISKGIQTVKSYDYSYFTDPANALWSAKRELNQQAFPLSSFSIVGNRDLYEVRIGDVVVLNWKPYGISDMAVRITAVDISELADGKITLEGIEDVFGLDKSDFIYSGGTEFIEENKYPSGIEHFQFLELPYEMTGTEAHTYVAAFATDPLDEVTTSWSVWRKPWGAAIQKYSTLSKFTATGTLTYGLLEEDDLEDALGFAIEELDGISRLPYEDTEDFENARTGPQLLLVEEEIIAFSGLRKMPNNRWQVLGVLRGVFDTVPSTHPSGTPVYFVEVGHYQHVTGGNYVCRSNKTTTEYYNLTTASALHEEEFDDARTNEFTTKSRALRPVAPGRIRMSDMYNTAVDRLPNVTGALEISFVPRNKLLYAGAISQEDTVHYNTNTAFETGEGVDYVLELDNDEEIARFDFTESPAKVTWEDICMNFNAIERPIEFTANLYARKDDLLSYQPQHRSFGVVVPTLVGVVADRAEAEKILRDNGERDGIRIFATDPSKSTTVSYKDLPIFIVGTPSGTRGGLVGEDGTKYDGTDEIYIVKDRNTLIPYNMKEGYAFRSFFTGDIDDGDILEWYGDVIQERQLRVHTN